MILEQLRCYWLRTRLLSFAVLLSVCFVLLAGCNGDAVGVDEDLVGPALAELTVQGGGDMYPQFDARIRHYAVKCRPSDVLSLSAKAVELDSMVSIDGSSPTEWSAQATFSNLPPDQDIVVDVTAGLQVSRYTLHCLAEDFPDIQVVYSEQAVTPGLILVAPRFQLGGQQLSYIVILDNNGVPHFRRKIEAAVLDFKRHPNGLYSYLLLQGQNEYAVNDFVVVILDPDFNEIDRLQTVGLTQTDGHDFVFTEEGNRIFISYNSTIRDMSAFGLSTEEVVGDSVIQEVDSDGEVVFQWDSWGHLDLNDCRATGFTRFPSDYAHLNSIDLTPDGDLIASFRGCAQVVKIDRPSGDVIWRLGGSNSDFTIVGDPFNEFCGQHTALEVTADHILMFDNGGYCLSDRAVAFGVFSRVVEYRLDSDSGQANFVRDYSLNGTYQEYTASQGSVQALSNGNWFVNWGRGPQMSVTEVDSSGNQIFEMKILFNDAIAASYRAFRDEELVLD